MSAPEPIGFCSACSTPLYAGVYGGRCVRCGGAGPVDPQAGTVDAIEDAYARGEIDVDELERELVPAIERESRQ